MGNGKDYYLGLDIGTDSVGYAVTDLAYELRKFKGEPMWGTHLFEAGQDAADRRSHRTARRRIDRRQQRVSLVNDLFAQEIARTDPDFFTRRRESALFAEDTQHGVALFSGEGITDKEYHRRYPTIHHLILELMTSDAPHDARLVYLACAWLVAHRGHFLFDIDGDKIDQLLDFEAIYRGFREYLQDQECCLPWPDTVMAEDILEILQMDTGVTRKKEAFKTRIFGGKKIGKEPCEEFPYSAEAVVGLLSGGTVKPKDLFGDDAFADVASVSLQMGDEEFDQILSELGEEGELLIKLRGMHSCAKLIATMADRREGDPMCISASKVAVYERHGKDLATLKRLVKKYCPGQYHDIFRGAVAGNYVAYSGNVKSCPEPEKVKGVGKVEFCDLLRKKLKGLKVRSEDRADYDDMMSRIESYSFLPKQRDTDNRIIPQQLYRQELAALLKQAENYLPMLTRRDEDGLTVTEKLLSIFDFRIPYYVGPLVKRAGSTAWIVREQGRILPWNFEQMVDLDASEQGFINRMVGGCTYLAGEKVLPEASLLYEKFTVLNELNNMKLDGREIPVMVKRAIFTELFMERPRVTVKDIKKYLIGHGYMGADGELSGLDITFKAGLRSRHIFRRMLDKGLLTEEEVEQIILHAAYTEDRGRMRRWISAGFPQLSEEDVGYILRQKLKGFGRLSRRLLTQVYGAEKGSNGEAMTLIGAMWDQNRNLMQLLSERYTFRDQIQAHNSEYYADHPRKLTDRLSEMYVSNGAKRPLFRTLDIVSDVVKATGSAPKKIFVEMARGGSPDQKGKRTLSRSKQLLGLYKKVRTEDAMLFASALEAMGADADRRLQDRKLYLYYLQLGKCAYTGEPIDLGHLADGTYDLEHIYPQSQVKDDSILNNLVLVKSEANGQKRDTYPVDKPIRDRMKPMWMMLRQIGLMTEEKYRRLTRPTPFTADEKMGFIARQLVETRQSTKVIATLLKERFPETEIVYVKAGLVSEFRQEFDMLKCRAVNDLHHAKDAYLNIVVGNVYNERFTKKWFRVEEHYNVQVKKIFARTHCHGETVYWNGEADIARVRKTMAKNAVHLTRFAFYRKGQLFDQQPLKAAEGLIPLKKDLPTEKYGGYNKATATGFVLVRFQLKGKPEIMLVAVDLMVGEQMMADRARAEQYAAGELRKMLGKEPENMELLLEGRVLKINTVFCFDGVPMALAGKSTGGAQMLMSPLVALVLPKDLERYSKRLESFQNKQKINKALLPDADHDGISPERNIALYDALTEKMRSWPFAKFPGNQYETMCTGAERFASATVTEQIDGAMNILLLMGPGSSTVDLTVCGGSKNAGAKRVSSKVSNWKKNYSDVRILDLSASGLYSKRSGNLLELL